MHASDLDNEEEFSLDVIDDWESEVMKLSQKYDRMHLSHMTLNKVKLFRKFVSGISTNAGQGNLSSGQPVVDLL